MNSVLYFLVPDVLSVDVIYALRTSERSSNGTRSLYPQNGMLKVSVLPIVSVMIPAHVYAVPTAVSCDRWKITFLLPSSYVPVSEIGGVCVSPLTLTPASTDLTALSKVRDSSCCELTAHCSILGAVKVPVSSCIPSSVARQLIGVIAVRT